MKAIVCLAFLFLSLSAFSQSTVTPSPYLKPKVEMAKDLDSKFVPLKTVANANGGRLHHNPIKVFAGKGYSPNTIFKVMLNLKNRNFQEVYLNVAVVDENGELINFKPVKTYMMGPLRSRRIPLFFRLGEIENHIDREVTIYFYLYKDLLFPGSLVTVMPNNVGTFYKIVFEEE